MFISALTGPFALIVTPLAYMARQYAYWPYVMDQMDKNVWKKIQSYPLGKAGQDKNLTYFIYNGFNQLCQDFTVINC
jgi:hypothetical protein